MADSRATSVTQPSVAGVDLHLELNGSGLRAGLMGALREAVRAGRLVPGTRLPSARSLAADLGVARNTVADAYAELVAEGGSPHSRGPGAGWQCGPSRAELRPHSRHERSPTPAAADPGVRVNAELKNWKILRKIRSSPNNADKLIPAVQTLMIASGR
jgi:DNA-binding transcriptional MocR family regulator